MVVLLLVASINGARGLALWRQLWTIHHRCMHAVLTILDVVSMLAMLSARS